MAINQVIYCVRGRPFSIEFMTCSKKQMLQRYWKFAGYIIIWRERSTAKDNGAVLHNDFAASLYVRMRWPHWTVTRLWQILYYINILSWLFSSDHTGTVIPTKQKEQPVTENEASLVTKHHNEKLTSQLFWARKYIPSNNNTIILLSEVLYSV